MKIGFCYDTTEAYDDAEDNLEYTDFISLHTISEIGKAIEQNGYELEYIGNGYKLYDQLVHNTFNCDLIFNIAGGFLPNLLDLYQIPHTTSDTSGSSIFEPCCKRKGMIDYRIIGRIIEAARIRYNI